MSKLKFDIAISDVEAAEQDRASLHLTVLEIAGEEYAAVRPAPGAFVEMLNLAHQVRAQAIDQVVGVLMFLNECFSEDDLRPALVDSGLYEPGDTDPEGAELNAEGEQLAISNRSLYARFRSHGDDLGVETLAAVMLGLCEEWSGNPIGSPTGSSGGRSTTGPTSTGRSSRKASTSRGSASKVRRVS